jgi:hypothetical protein
MMPTLVQGQLGIATPSPFGGLVLGLRFEGSGGSTTFTDVTGKTVTSNGNAQIDTAQFKFGSSSGLFDGSGDFLTISSTSAFDVPTQTFQIDFWVRFNSTASASILTQRAAGTGFYPWQISRTSGNKIGFRGFDGGTTLIYDIVGTTTVTTGVWYHVAATRVGSAFRLFVDGVQEGSATTSTALRNVADNVVIGAYDVGIFGLNGWMDDFRFIIGSPVWENTFSPPQHTFST